MNSISFLEKGADNDVALVDREKEYKYSELKTLIAKLTIKAKHRNLVFILCRNSADCIILYLFCLKEGHVPLLLPEQITNEKLDALNSTYQPNYIFYPKNRENPRIGLNTGAVTDFMEYVLTEVSATNHNLHNDLGLLLTTSGSTGSPKIVRLSYKNIVSNCQAIVSYLKITSQDSHITTLPMCYTYGLSCIHSHLEMGAKLILTDNSVIDKQFWITYLSAKPTSFAGVPYIYELIIKLGVEKLVTDKLRYVTVAGGKLDTDKIETLLDKLEPNKIELFIMYGQTEATARMSYVPSNMAREKKDSIGIPIKGGEFLIDSQSEELIYKGENVFMGYAYDKQDLGKCDYVKGRLETGDLAYQDKDGYTYIKGRSKRFAKINGTRLDLEYLEKEISSKYAKCIIVSNDKSLKIVFENESYQELGMEITLLKKSLRQLLSTSCKVPPSSVELSVIPSFPRTISGKINYSEV